MQKINQIHPNIWGIDEVFNDSYYTKGLEEFNAKWTHWEFMKKETNPGDPMVFPKFGNVYKPKWYKLGDNLTFIELAEIAKYTVMKLLKRRVVLSRINTNIQFAGQEAAFHEDGGPKQWTLLCFMQTHWEAEWGGPFQILVEGPSPGPLEIPPFEEILVPFAPNKGVLFRGDYMHRGNAPNTLCPTERLSLAFTYTEVDAIVEKREEHT